MLAFGWKRYVFKILREPLAEVRHGSFLSVRALCYTLSAYDEGFGSSL